MKHLSTLVLFLTALIAGAQEDLLEGLDPEIDQEVIATWKSLKVVNFETTKLVAPKEFQLIISHRFGSVENGIDDLFGMDNAVTRFQFAYGLTEWMHVEASRTGFNKTYQLATKFKLKKQIEEGFPFSIALFTAMDANTELDKSIYPKLEFIDRLGYTAQFIVARKISKRLSAQLSPTLFHQNFVTFDPQDNTQYAMGLGARYKLTNRWSLNADYGYHLNRADGSPFVNPLSIGVDLETGGHVFQMHFTNAQPMLTNGFLSQATGDWTEGRFYFGFNLVRVF
jgi:opacity protein-like surface antigen